MSTTAKPKEDASSDDSSGVYFYAEDVEKSERMNAFARIHGDALVRFLSAQLGGNQHNAEDLAQECLVRLSRYVTPEITSAALRSISYQIARNIAIDFHRHQQVICTTDHIEIENQDIISADPSPERIIGGQQDLQQLEQVLLSLPTRCQEVFVLSRFEDMSHKQIAERYGISVSMVEKHIAKAMKLIRKKVRIG